MNMFRGLAMVLSSIVVGGCTGGGPVGSGDTTTGSGTTEGSGSASSLGPGSVDGNTAGSEGNLDSGGTTTDGGVTSEDSGTSGSDSTGGDTEGGVGPSCDAYVPSDAIELSSGQVVSCMEITTATGPCIRGNGVSGVQITNNRIGPCGQDQQGVAVQLEDSSDVRIDHNAIDDVMAGLYALGGGDDIVFDHNYVTDLHGIDFGAMRGMVQLNKVSGTGIKILCNVDEQTVPASGEGLEDHVSIYASSGTSESPIEVAYNKIRGGGPSQSGGGIISGEEDGRFTTNYVSVHDNILIEPGQYGLAMWGGYDIDYSDNRVWNGESHAWDNIGMYSPYAMPCSNHSGSGNRVWWINAAGEMNHYWGGNGECALSEDDNVFGDDTLDPEAMWLEVFAECG